MTELLGIPTDVLAIVLAAAMAVALAAVGALAARNRVFLRLGVRNLGRRRGRTALIVAGLMLGTTIIAAALATGDTMSHTIRSAAIRSLGQTDELVSLAGAEVDPSLADAAGGVFAGSFPQRSFEPVRVAAGRSPLIDGVTPAIMSSIAVQNERSRQNEPRVALLAPDPAHASALGPIRTTTGAAAPLTRLRAGEVYLNSDAADELRARPGDRVSLLVSESSTPARVRAIVDFDGTGDDGPGLLLPLAAAQRLLNRPGQIDYILVSNRGDELSGAELSDRVVAQLKPTLTRLGLKAAPAKQDAIAAADKMGAAFMSLFTTFGTFSIAAGGLLIFLIFVMLAAERRGELGIARAVGTRRSHLVQMFLFEGTAYDLLAAAVGAVAGIGVAYGMVLLIAKAFATTDLDIAFSITPRSVIIAYAIGMILTLAIVTISARKVSRMNIVTAIRDLPEPPAPRRRRRLVLPLAGLAAGGWMLAGAAGTHETASFLMGSALVLLSLVGLARALGVSDRVARSFGGLAMIAWFILPTGEWLIGDMISDFSAFVLSGLMIVVGTTWLIMHNADPVLRASARALARFPRLAPVLRMSMAYPLRSLFRTGVTMAMFTLVVLTLVSGATISGAFGNAFDDLRAFSGGFDVAATTAPGTPFADIPGMLERGRGVRPSDVTAVSSSSVVPVAARQEGAKKYANYLARGFNRTFFERTTYGFAAIARGYGDAADVWSAMRENPQLAVVDGLAAPRRQNYGFGGLSDFRLHGFYVEDQTFDPVEIDIRDPATGLPVKLTVIGVLPDTLPQSMVGIWTSQLTLAGVFGTQAIPTTHFFALRPGVSAAATASKLESEFLTAGMEADSMRKLLDDAVSANRTFNALMQGFMALGLVVGVVALGVISARSVVERRQQIGVLRAIGFRRRMVQLCFVLESSFIALTSIVVGTVTGLALAYSVIQDSQRQPSWSNMSFDVPWINLGIIFLTVFVVTVLASLAPSIRASRVPPAEALRYQ